MFIVLEISSQDWNALATEFTHIAQNVRGIHIRAATQSERRKEILRESHIITQLTIFTIKLHNFSISYIY